MDFNSAIKSMMQDVNDGSQEPFIIYRDNNGDWHSDYTQNQYGETFDWVTEAKEQDYLALEYKGSDFSKGSFPYVYDAVLCDRIRAEYYLARSSGKDNDTLHALTCFFNDNVSELSHTVTDYLTTLDRPLAALGEMCPFDLATDFEGWSFNVDLAADAIDYIENAVHDRLHISNDKPVPEKHSFDGYEEISSIQVNGRLMFVGEKQNAEYPYMVAEFKWDNPFGAMENEFTGLTGDYLEALDEFRKLVEHNVNVVKSDRQVRNSLDGVEPLTLTVADCIPNGLEADLTGKLIVIKPEALAPEYHRADYQLRICVGGFGASPGSRGNAVFCKELFYGKENRFERYDVLGVADIDKLPQWAKAKLKAYEVAQSPNGITADGTFYFSGYHFTPYRKFGKGEVDKPLDNDSRPWKKDAQYAMRNMRSDPDLYIGKESYTHAKFYEASCNSEADIFICAENGRLYVPGENEVFLYNEPPQIETPEKTDTQLCKECAAAIDGAVAAEYTPGEMAGTGIYKLDAALKTLTDKFGTESVNAVLAAIVNQHDYDGRYSQTNKDWAKSIDTVSYEDIRYCTVNTHPAVLDGLVSKVRKADAERQAKKPSLLGKLDDNKEKVERGKAERKDKPVPKKSGDLEVD